jgi:hypothetical protein
VSKLELVVDNLPDPLNLSDLKRLRRLVQNDIDRADWMKIVKMAARAKDGELVMKVAKVLYGPEWQQQQINKRVREQAYWEARRANLKQA